MLTEKVIELTNVEREKAGLQPLKINNQLANAAQDHSNDMAQDDFFSHTGADGSSVSDRVEDSGYQYSTTGENIAAGQTSPEEVVEGWMNSPGHRANILNPDYTEIGVGYEQLQNDPGSVNYDSYWTQVFGNSSEDNSDSSKSLNSDAIEDSTSFTSTPNENLMINTDSSSDRSLFIDDDTKSFDSNPDRMEDSQTFTGIPSEDLMVNNDNNSSNNDFEINDNSTGFTDAPKKDPMDSNNNSLSDNKFEIGDNSFARSLFMNDNTKSLDSDLIDSIDDSASIIGTPNEDPMVSADSSSDRSFFINDNTKSLDSNLVDLIPDSASFAGTPNEEPMVSTESSSDQSFFISNDTKSEDLVDLLNL